MDSVSRDTIRLISGEQKVMRATYEKYGSHIPNDEFEDDSEEQEKRREEHERKQYKNKTVRERDLMYEDYYGEQMMAFKDDHSKFGVYKSDTGDLQVMGIPSISETSQLSAVERIQSIYALAIERQKRYNGLEFSDNEDDEDEQEYSGESDDNDNDDDDEKVLLNASYESNEESSDETDESDECTATESEDSEEESFEAINSGKESDVSSKQTGEDSTACESSEDEELIYQEEVRKLYDNMYKYRHLVETHQHRDVSI